jgi:hypothetical protein
MKREFKSFSGRVPSGDLLRFKVGASLLSEK